MEEEESRRGKYVNTEDWFVYRFKRQSSKETNADHVHVLQGINNGQATCCKYEVPGTKGTKSKTGKFKDSAMVKNSLIKSLSWNKYVQFYSLIRLKKLQFTFLITGKMSPGP